MNAKQIAVAGISFIILSAIAMIIQVAVQAGGYWGADSTLQFYLLLALEIMFLPLAIGVFIVLRRRQRGLKPVSTAPI